MDNVDNTEEIRTISLCTGYGGIELGLKRVIPTLRTVAYVEIEAFACTNLVAKIEEGKLDAAPVWTDIKTFPAQYFRDRVHLITGGYPCQPFSVAGQRKGTDDPRHLWPYIERIIQAVRPVWCFFENVSGHLTIGFPEVYRSLRLMGYKVEAGLFTASECGSPQTRERLYILSANTKCNFNTKYVGNCGIQNLREKKTQIRSTYWDEFELVIGRMAPEKWKLTRQSNPRPLFLRDDNGDGTELDRLRLLGNGVVPQCAEKAFITLMELFKADK